MVWELDVDSIGSSQQLGIPSYIKLADFKNPGTRVLEIGSEHTEALLDKIPDLHLTGDRENSRGY